MLEILRLLIWYGFPLLLVLTEIFNFTKVGALLMLVAAIFVVISEVYILVFETKHIDYSKGIARILFLGKYPENTFWQESLVTAKGRRRFGIWILSILCVLYILSYIIFISILKIYPPVWV
jgi:hypothetical protein